MQQKLSRTGLMRIVVALLVAWLTLLAGSPRAGASSQKECRNDWSQDLTLTQVDIVPVGGAVSATGNLALLEQSIDEWTVCVSGRLDEPSRTWELCSDRTLTREQLDSP